MRQYPNQSQQLHVTCNDPMHHDLARNLLGNTVLHFTIVTTCTGKAVLLVVQYEGPVCIVCEGESHCHVRSMAQKDRPWSTQVYPWWSQFVDQWAFPMIPFVGRNRMVFVSYRGSSLFFSDDASVCEGRKGDSGEQTERDILDIPWYHTLCLGDPSRPLAHFHCWWFFAVYASIPWIPHWPLMLHYFQMFNFESFVSQAFWKMFQKSSKNEQGTDLII